MNIILMGCDVGWNSVGTVLEWGLESGSVSEPESTTRPLDSAVFAKLNKVISAILFFSILFSTKM